MRAFPAACWSKVETPLYRGCRVRFHVKNRAEIDAPRPAGMVGVLNGQEAYSESQSLGYFPKPGYRGRIRSRGIDKFLDMMHGID